MMMITMLMDMVENVKISKNEIVKKVELSVNSFTFAIERGFFLKKKRGFIVIIIGSFGPFHHFSNSNVVGSFA